MLAVYDVLIFAIVSIILLVLYGGMDKLSPTGILQQVCLSFCMYFRKDALLEKSTVRFGDMVESNVMSDCSLHDVIAFCIYLCLELILPVQKITFARMLSLASLNLLGALALRMMYRYAYKCANQETTGGQILSILLHLFSGLDAESQNDIQKIKIAIIGAGRIGVGLAEELLSNSETTYIPRSFIDINSEKVGTSNSWNSCFIRK